MKRRFCFWRVSTIVGFALALGFFSSGISLSYATEESSSDNGTDIAAVGTVDGNAADNHDAAGAYDTAAAAAAAGEDFDEDPWEGFNEKMFWFNREVLDRYVLKPVATAWDFDPSRPSPARRSQFFR